MSNLIGKPPYQAAMVDPSGFASREWLPWIQSLSAAGAAVVSAQAAIAALQAAAKTDEANILSLEALATQATVAIAAANTAIASLQTITGTLQSTVNLHTLKLGLLSAATAGGNLTEATSDVLTITRGAGAVLGAAGATIQVKRASASEDGYLSASDFAAFSSVSGATTHEELLVDTAGPITETTSDFIYVLGVSN